ncbi:MAG TPA: phosphoribosyltransferase family protein [Candidatus Limnocylindria bacterium]|nr:phosphoribosyltransferase family protein [Candidatus Limnocylindria bacterium]
MYFKSRAEAGRLLADKLEQYQKYNTAVVALTPGAVIVGAQIAMRLHSALAMLMTENITLPGENEPLAAITSDNTFTYNNKFSTGELEDLHAEYLGVIEGQRLEKLHKLHALLGHGGEIHRELLTRHTVILVADGLSTGLSLDLASDYFKSIKLEKLIIVTPFASVNAVDKMHLVGDEIVCLSVVENYIDTNHYYDDNTIPPVEDLIKIITTTPVHWTQSVNDGRHFL